MTSSTHSNSTRARPTGSFTTPSSGSQSGSGSHSSSPSASTPPLFGSNYHPNSVNTAPQRAPSRLHQPTSSTSSDTESSFVGTPFAFALERPYEYPFPSPATESCPNLSTNASVSLGLAHLPSPTQALLSSPVKEVIPLPSILPPPVDSVHSQGGVLPLHPPSRPIEGRTARMSLLLRRKSHAPQDTIAPVPPGLLAKARDLGRRKSISAGAAMRNHGRQLSLGVNGGNGSGQ